MHVDRIRSSNPAQVNSHFRQPRTQSLWSARVPSKGPGYEVEIRSGGFDEIFSCQKKQERTSWTQLKLVYGRNQKIKEEKNNSDTK